MAMFQKLLEQQQLQTQQMLLEQQKKHAEEMERMHKTIADLSSKQSADTCDDPGSDDEFDFDGAEKFEEEGYTLSMFIEESVSAPLTKKKLLNNLMKCLAFYSKDGSYLVNEENEDSRTIETELYSKARMSDKLGMTVRYKTKVRKIRKDKKTGDEKVELKTESSSIKLIKLVDDTDFSSKVRKYRNMSLRSTDSRVFCTFRPPNKNFYLDPVKYDRQLIIDYITMIAGRYKNPNAWYDRLNTMKYLITGSSGKKPTRFFVNFSLYGGSGKSLVEAGFKRLFRKACKTGINPKVTSSEFNGYLLGIFYLAFEEADDACYADKQIQEFIKRLTGEDFGCRQMYKDLTEGVCYAVGSLNTNDVGCYGLVRAARPVQRRLVFGVFKEANEDDMTDDKWFHWSKIIKSNKDFGYSFHRYILEDYPYTFLEDDGTLRADFKYNPERFDDNTFDAVGYLKKLKKSSVEKFIDMLVMHDSHYGSGDPRKPKLNLLHYYGGDRKGYYFLHSEGLYDNFILHHNSEIVTGKRKYPISEERFTEELKSMGWEFNAEVTQNKVKVRRIYRNDNFEYKHSEKIVDDDELYLGGGGTN